MCKLNPLVLTWTVSVNSVCCRLAIFLNASPFHILLAVKARVVICLHGFHVTAKSQHQIIIYCNIQEDASGILLYLPELEELILKSCNAGHILGRKHLPVSIWCHLWTIVVILLKNKKTGITKSEEAKEKSKRSGKRNPEKEKWQYQQIIYSQPPQSRAACYKQRGLPMAEDDTRNRKYTSPTSCQNKQHNWLEHEIALYWVYLLIQRAFICFQTSVWHFQSPNTTTFHHMFYSLLQNEGT